MVSWTLESYTASFTARVQAAALSYAGKFTLLGGVGFADAWQMSGSTPTPPAYIAL